MKVLVIIASILMLSGCSKTTAHKAKSNGWNEVIEAKTISLAEKDCLNHQGYYKSTQMERWHGWDNNYYTYTSVEVICTDGFIIQYDIDKVNQHFSDKVAELLRAEN